MMEMLYRAYGLRLASSFPLVGTEKSDDAHELPPLALSMLEPGELEHEWSATEASPEWRGRLGDGRELSIERGSAGDLLFGYGELARFHLDADMLRLGCAPSGEGLDWQRTLIGKVVPSIAVMRGYEALHAAALDSPEGVVAIMGPAGSGKSTLALELLRRGWPLFADDQLTLAHAGEAIVAHPGTPHMNLALELPAGFAPDSLGDTLAILAGERWLAARSTSIQVRPVRLLCLLERGPGLTTGIQRLPRSPLELAPYMLGIPIDTERERARFALFCDLTESVPMVRVSGDVEQRPEQLADLVELALEDERQPVAAVAR
jgi:hypothetical protein